MRNRYTEFTGKLPTDKELRKKMPIGTGVLDYFPDALAAVAYVSYVGNQQHNPGEPLHWARGKSTDQDDCIIRHFMEREIFDDDKCRHSAKLVWRALANLQLEIEEARMRGEAGICAEDIQTQMPRPGLTGTEQKVSSYGFPSGYPSSIQAPQREVTLSDLGHNAPRETLMTQDQIRSAK